MIRITKAKPKNSCSLYPLKYAVIQNVSLFFYFFFFQNVSLMRRFHLSDGEFSLASHVSYCTPKKIAISWIGETQMFFVIKSFGNTLNFYYILATFGYSSYAKYN